VIERYKDVIFFPVLTSDMKTLFEDEVFLNGMKNLSFITSAIDFKTFTVRYCSFASIKSSE